MLIGGVVPLGAENPEKWVQKAVDIGYQAVTFPLDFKADIKEIDSLVSEINSRNLKIAEVGIWRNVFDKEKGEENMFISKKQLELADYVKAGCCVNISGSRSKIWDGPHRDNITEETFFMIVDSCREIIDEVKPKNTYFTLEPMPWMYPHTADSYLKLISEIDKERFAVHLDLVNVVNSFDKYYNNSGLIDEWFIKLRPYIKSCHAKDIIIDSKLTLHLNECCPGDGILDYNLIIKHMKKLSEKTTLMLEHMTLESDYIKGIQYLNKVINSFK